MKRIVTLIIFFIVSFKSFGQKIRFTDSSNVWDCFYASSGILPPIYWTFRDRYDNDTTIHGLNYKKLWHLVNYAYIREDTILRRVFAIYPVYAGDSSEHLLYDYSLSVGDSFFNSFQHFYVFGIDSVFVGPLSYKVWHLRPAGSFSADIPIVEGMGSISDPLAMIEGSFGEGGNVLSCFQHEGSEPLISPPFGPYYFDISPLTPFYLDNNTSCRFDPLYTQSILNNATSLQLFPNPSLNELNITYSEEIRSIEIIDLTGQVHLSVLPSTTFARVNVSSLSNGMYIVRVNKTLLQKFIKQ